MSIQQINCHTGIICRDCFSAHAHHVRRCCKQEADGIAVVILKKTDGKRFVNLASRVGSIGHATISFASPAHGYRSLAGACPDCHLPATSACLARRFNHCGLGFTQVIPFRLREFECLVIAHRRPRVRMRCVEQYPLRAQPDRSSQHTFETVSVFSPNKTPVE